ncbi:Uncharacterised protein [Bordetella pertussis]|nr:Uncharacterised protein [Bordetella pertussis]
MPWRVASVRYSRGARTFWPSITVSTYQTKSRSASLSCCAVGATPTFRPSALPTVPADSISLATNASPRTGRRLS